MSKIPEAKLVAPIVVRPIIRNIQIPREIEPLVTVSPDEEFINVYHLYITLYLMDGTSQPVLNDDFNNIEKFSVGDGNDVWLRKLSINYFQPAVIPEQPTFTVWDIHCDYKVSSAETAFGLHTVFNADDPITSRGTITIVLRS